MAAEHFALPDPLSAAERYHIFRDQIQHEDNLTTQRLSWLMASQAFMFSAYAITLNAPNRTETSFVATQQAWLLTSIPELAFCSAVLIYVSIVAGAVALRSLHRRAEPLCRRDGVSSAFPPIQGSWFTRMAGLTSPMVLPPLFAGVWLFLLIRGLAR